MKKYNLVLNVEILQEYSIEAKDRDEAEAMALEDFREHRLIDVPPDKVFGWAKFSKEEDIDG